MLMILDNPAGYVVRITKSDLFEIPEDVESFPMAMELIAAVWMMKLRVKRAIHLIQGVGLDLSQIGFTKKKTVERQLPRSLSTPPKSRTNGTSKHLKKRLD